MRYIYHCLTFHILLVTQAVFAQTSDTYTIQGRVIDSATNKPVDYVTVSLDKTNGDPMKAGYSKTDGSFILDKIVSGTYMLHILYVGYGSKSIRLNVSGNFNLGTISLSSQSKQLSEVQVTAMRQIVRQDVDRITYDIQADPDSKTLNMLDMMRKVPLLSIDAADNIRLKGNSDYKILINGKPSGLMTRNPRDALRSMRAGNIKSVEVITTPPARYESEGLAGIINIITNQRTDEGYNGDVGLYYITYESHGTWTDLNVKKGKFGAVVYAEGFIRNGPDLNFTNVRESTQPFMQRVEQRGKNNNNNSGKGLYITTDLSFEIDSLNLLTANIGYYPEYIDRKGEMSVITNNIDNGNTYLLDNTDDYSRDALDLGVNYQLGFKNNKDRLLSASYKYMWAATDQNIMNIATANVFYNDNNILNQLNKAASLEQTAQLDFVHPLKRLSIEGGFKAIFRDNNSDFSSRTFMGNNGAILPENVVADKFDYLQKVYAFYNSYEYKVNEKNSLKAGLRLERTVIDADFTTSGIDFNTGYNKLIPSVALLHKFKNAGNLNFGYTQRIQRPNIWQLNPFVNTSNPVFYTSGNPDLKPVLNHNFELNYSKFGKGTFVGGISYSFADNTIQNVVALGADSISRSSYQNLGKNDNIGADINFNYPITEKLSVNFGGRLAYLWMDGLVNGNPYSNKGMQGHFTSNWSYGFGNNWRLSADINYNSRSLSLQGETSSFTYSAVRVSKDVFKKQGTFMLAVINPFPQYRTLTTKLNTEGFMQQYQTRVLIRGVHLNFYYRFGKLKEAVKKNRRGVNNDDVEKLK
ncbi:TonB-dependent receptor [Mucilaginibacter limnophilus]|uniref:TonB-dependent receptor n=1 Tax=Mucilaginibacter limnophilus TaxID=1932778 RepID=A0A437MSC8_9SPHI|nr:outer membrane beta-barrel family protein [Mucilaginibacter limnophilus]RVU00571.1 TonB-dependent receptor [Mucilaginibacter limnophilus]